MNKPGPRTHADLPVHRRTYTVDDETHRWLTGAGGGNASRGARVAAKLWFQAYQADRLPSDAPTPAWPATPGRSSD